MLLTHKLVPQDDSQQRNRSSAGDGLCCSRWVSILYTPDPALTHENVSVTIYPQSLQAPRADKTRYHRSSRRALRALRVGPGGSLAYW